MNIRKLGFGTMAALVWTLAANAQASITFSFGPAATCPTYCAGFTTDNPAYTVDFINPRYNNTTIVSINGVVYRGPAAWVAVGTNGAHTIYQETNVVLTAPDGRYLVATVTEEYWTTRVNSGRAHYTLPHNYVTGGTITLPLVASAPARKFTRTW